MHFCKTLLFGLVGVSLAQTDTGTSAQLALREVSNPSLTEILPEVQRDASSQKLLGTIGDMMVFFVKYQQFRSFLSDKDTPVVAAAGKPLSESHAGMTIETLSESLWQRMKDKSSQFVTDYNYVGRICGDFLIDLKSMMDIQKKINSAKPLSVSKIDKIFDAGKFNTALKRFGEAEDVMAEADLLFQNLGKKDHLSKELLALEDEKNNHTHEANVLKAKIEQTNSNLTQSQADFAQATSMEKTLADRTGQISSSNQAMIGYLEDEVNQLTAALQKATEDEKTYTYRMYGYQTYMWENDVKLAKEKVSRYTTELKAKQDQLQEVQKDPSVYNLGEEKANNRKKTVECQKTVKLLSSALAEMNTMHMEHVLAQQNITAQQETIIKNQSAVNYRHLLDALRAKSRFADTAVRAADEASHVSDFMESFAKIGGYVEFLKDADDVAEQEHVIVEMEKQQGTPMWKLVGSTKLSTLLPSLSDEEIQQAITHSLEGEDIPEATPGRSRLLHDEL